jgi:hypothetical protein
MISRRNFRKNRNGIGTVFAMVFFLLIVMLVFASFMIILNQNTGLEQTVIQTRQIDQDRANEQLAISPKADQTNIITANTNTVTVNVLLNNTGTLPVQLIRLWVRDLANSAAASSIVSSSVGSLTQGRANNYTGVVTFPTNVENDQFIFWFETSRGNQFTLGQSNGGGSLSQVDFSKLLSGVFGDFLVDYHSVEWAFVTTASGVSVTGPWQNGWIIPTGSNNQYVAFRLNLTYYGDSMMRIDNDTNILFKNLQDNSIVFEGSSYNYATDRGTYPTLFISNYDKTSSTLSSYNGHEIAVDSSANPVPITVYFSTVQQFTSDWPNAEGKIYSIGSPTHIGYPISSLQPNAMMTLSLYGMSPSNYAQSYPLFAVQSRPIGILLSPASGTVGTLVTVTGTKFAGSSTVTLQFDSTQLTIPTIRTDPTTGNFPRSGDPAVTFRVSASTVGDHMVTATDDSSSHNSATATFTFIKASSSISTPTLNPSSPITLGSSVTASITVSGVSGFTPTGTVTFQVSTDNGNTWNTFGAEKTLVSGSATSDSYTPDAVGSNYRIRAIVTAIAVTIVPPVLRRL